MSPKEDEEEEEYEVKEEGRGGENEGEFHKSFHGGTKTLRARELGNLFMKSIKVTMEPAKPHCVCMFELLVWVYMNIRVFWKNTR